MDPDLARAFEFILHADMAGTRVEPFRFGLSVRMPECPRRQDSNYLLVDPVPPGVGAEAFAAEADRVQRAAGLRHRCLMFRDAGAADPLLRRGPIARARADVTSGAMVLRMPGVASAGRRVGRLPLAILLGRSRVPECHIAQIRR